MRRTKVSREARVGQVQAWLASGLSCRAFAEQSGLSAATLSWWKRRLESEGVDLNRRRGRSRPAFIEVTPQLASLHESPVEVRVELEIKGVVVRLPSEFHENTLRRVLDVLEARP
jgi:transposase